MWRFTTLLKRDKQSLWYAIGYPLMFMGIAFMVGNPALKAEQTSFDAITNAVVTSTQYNSDGANYFADSDLNTKQNFEQCVLNQAENIGLVKEDKFGSEANQILESIFTEINDAYLNFNQKGLKKIIFDSQAKANDYIHSDNYATDKLCFTLAWSKFQTDVDQPDFALKISTDLTQSEMPDPNIPQDRSYIAKYTKESLNSFNETNFLQVMTLATKAIIEQQGDGNSNSEFSIMYTPMDTGEYDDYGKDEISMVCSLIFESLALGIAVFLGSAREPQEGMIELIMKRLGVQKSVIVTRDLTITTIYGAFWALIITLFIWGIFVREEIDFFVLLIFSILNQVQVILRQQVIGNIISPVLSSLVVVILQIFQISLSFVIVADVPNQGMATLGCIISPMMQIQMVLHMAFLQKFFGTKLNFNDFGEQVFPGISLTLVLIIAVSMALFYGLVIIYLWPLKIETDPEKPLKWYYPFTCSFWGICNKRCREVSNDPPVAQIDIESRTATETSMISSKTTPPVPTMVDVNVKIQLAEQILISQGVLEIPEFSNNDQNGKLVVTNLTKKFGSKTVVDNLSLTMYQNEILVLLGHNGAGKTTTLNMLTGLTQPTYGMAVAHGVTTQSDKPVDLFQDYQNIADFIGLCPQVDVLFTKMTVRENLIFYCKLKDVQDANAVIDETLEKFNLAAKHADFAEKLSGGQKRKLQLAIALLGNSKIVLLDEPTSGMDPTARRETWEIIKQAKKDKIIILTTHYMDEAEYLADRVAVISRGQLKICGTTSFLKSSFGHFFYLEVDPMCEDLRTLDVHLEMNNLRMSSQNLQEENYESDRAQEIPKIDIVPVTHSVDEAGKVVYKLPNYMAARFNDIFAAVDADPASFGINSYTIKNMTLEQVFIAIGDDEQKKDQEQLNKENKIQQLIDELPQLEKPSKFSLFKAMLVGTAQQYANMGIPVALVVFLVLLLLIFTGIYAPALARTEDTLSYANVESIFDGQQLDLKYNQKYQDATENTIVAKIMAQYDSDFTGTVQRDTVWNQPNIANYTEFLTAIADSGLGQSDSEKGAYWVNAEQDPDSSDWKIDAVVYIQATSPAAAPVFGNLMLQSIAQTITGNDKLRINFEYQAYEQTVSMQEQSEISFRLPTLAVGGLFSFFLEMGLLLLMVQLLQSNYYNTVLTRGATCGTFMLPRLVCDFFAVFFFFESVWFSNVIFGIDTTGWQQLGLLWCLAQALYIAALNVLMTKSRAFMGLKIALLVATILLCSFGGNFASEYADKQDGQSTARVVCWVGLLLPTIQLLYGILFIQYRQVVYVLTEQGSSSDTVEAGVEVTPFSEHGAKIPITILCIQIALYGTLLILVLLLPDCGPRRESEVQPEIDQQDIPGEVKNECRRVQDLMNTKQSDSGSQMDMLMVDNLVKRYYTNPPTSQESANQDDRIVSEEDQSSKKDAPKVKGFNAVKGTSFGVKRGEVFSLLGVNGAGKSSTFNCLVGQSRVSGGKVMIDGQNVDQFVGKPSKLHGLVGYCPQTNCFDGSLTVRQTITLFAQVVGIPSNRLKAYVDSTIHRFGLSQFPDTQGTNLSGGNMRKLSLATAMLGRPKIIYIDEASTGVDPVSRRTMWQAIRHEGQNSAVVLTTHAMEEAEAISSKIAIQVQGWFRAFGTLAQIQQEGKSGYFIDLNINLDLVIRQFEGDLSEGLVKDQQSVLRAIKQWEERLTQLRGDGKQLNFSDEFKPFGLLDRFQKRIENGQGIDLKNMLRELLLQDSMATIMNDFDTSGMVAKVKKHEGSQFQIEVADCQKSFGAMYIFMERLKSDHHIKEYSCKHSSLEEVFNTHASQNIYKDLNVRLERRRTLTQSQIVSAM